MIVLWLLGGIVILIVGIMIVQEWQFRKRGESEEEPANYCVHRVLENGELISFRMRGPIRIGEQRGKSSGANLF